ncbi:hypothetical protein BU14_0359s0011 [Porphyra umbilicalis]|uniref:Uncharacterized protein n=1 Tax=Porphyra umbilicalis TaxID=2786 RepID=A0A1X6NY46_PORUM|nr:hypothetical protein BU14_0359s0011 [Porphyra umbilicalis]|eukprot:OSX73303.1 hypothetical protein BU14_0359s0011 [Porphyra umbilicalis]
MSDCLAGHLCRERSFVLVIWSGPPIVATPTPAVAPHLGRPATPAETRTRRATPGVVLGVALAWAPAAAGASAVGAVAAVAAVAAAAAAEAPNVRRGGEEDGVPEPRLRFGDNSV